MKQRFAPHAALLCMLFVMYSCGYTMRSGIAPDMRSVNVAAFGNETYEHGIGDELAGFLSREFIVDGTLAVAGADTADVRISGSVREYILEPYAYGEREADVEQYRLRIGAAVELASLPRGAPLWKENIEGEAVYHAAGRLARTEEQAREDALKDLSRRIVRRTAGAW